MAVYPKISFLPLFSVLFRHPKDPKFDHHRLVLSYLIKFLLRILGALTAAPTKEDPVNQMPQAAPTTLKPKPKATPKLAYP
jgi:hypothetical protein